MALKDRVDENEENFKELQAHFTSDVKMNEVMNELHIVANSSAVKNVKNFFLSW